MSKANHWGFAFKDEAGAVREHRRCVDRGWTAGPITQDERGLWVFKARPRPRSDAVTGAGLVLGNPRAGGVR